VAAHVLDKLAAAAPVRLADRPYPADQLLRRMLADRIADLTGQHNGRPPVQLVLSHPTRWPAAAVAYATDHTVPDGAAVLVCDVGATTDEVFVVPRR
jgi:hypothetical protein